MTGEHCSHGVRPAARLEEAELCGAVLGPGEPGARDVAYLDGGLGEVEGGGQLAAPRPRHVVLAVELLLQPGDLLAGESGAVPTHLVGPRRRASQRPATAVQAADGGSGSGGRGAGSRAALRVACGASAQE